MAKTIRVLILFFFLGVFGLTATSSRGQTTGGRILLTVPVFTQKTPEWCWLAASQMAIAYRNNGQSPMQCQMLEIGYGLPPGYCCGNLARCVRPAYGMREIQAVIMRFGGTATILTSPLDQNTLYAAIQNGEPVIAQIVTGMSSTHAIVIRGMQPHSEWRNIYGRMMLVNDPYVFINDPMSTFPKVAQYSRLLSVWLNSIVVTHFQVTPPAPPPSAPANTGGSSAGGTSTSSFCTTLKRVIGDAPTYSPERGKRSEQDDDTTYDSRVNISPLHDCFVDVNHEDGSTEFMCESGTRDLGCEENVRRAKQIAGQLRSCLGTNGSKKTPSRSFPYRFEIDDPSHGVGIDMHIYRLHSGQCRHGVFSIHPIGS